MSLLLPYRKRRKTSTRNYCAKLFGGNYFDNFLPVCYQKFFKNVFSNDIGDNGTSDKQRVHKLKFLGPDIFRWGGCLPCKGVGAQKVQYVPQNPEKTPLGGISRDFGWDIPGLLDCEVLVGF